MVKNLKECVEQLEKTIKEKTEKIESKKKELSEKQKGRSFAKNSFRGIFDAANPLGSIFNIPFSGELGKEKKVFITKGGGYFNFDSGSYFEAGKIFESTGDLEKEIKKLEEERNELIKELQKTEGELSHEQVQQASK